jgi:hypothetical protein
MGNAGSFQWVNSRGVNVTIHLHLVPRSRMVDLYLNPLYHGVINEDLVYKKIICGTNANRIKLLGKYLFKVKCKWENKVRGDLNPHPKTSW